MDKKIPFRQSLYIHRVNISSSPRLFPQKMEGRGEGEKPLPISKEIGPEDEVEVDKHFL